MHEHEGMQTTKPTSAAIVLVPGHWLGAWAWDAVAADLRSRGHDVSAVTLPGLDPDEAERGSTTVADQAAHLRSIVAAAAAAGAPVVLVAHSGAGCAISVLLDQDPTAVARVIYVDSGPSADGSAFDASVPPDQTEVPLRRSTSCKPASTASATPTSNDSASGRSPNPDRSCANTYTLSLIHISEPTRLGMIS